MSGGRYGHGSTLYEGSVGNFYSPVESPNNSDDDDDGIEAEFVDIDNVRVPRHFVRRNKHYTSQV